MHSLGYCADPRFRVKLRLTTSQHRGYPVDMVQRLQPPMPIDHVAAFAAHLGEVRHRRPRTVARYLRVLRRLERDLVLPVTDATSVDLVGFLRAQSKGNSAPASWNTQVSALRGFYRWLLAGKSISHDPTLVLERRRDHRPEQSPLGFDELLRLVGAAQRAQPRYRARNVALLMTLIHTGLRVAEVVSLDLAQLDFDNHEFRGVTTKGGKTISVAFNDVVHTRLEEYVGARSESASDPALFLSDRGSRLAIRSVQVLVRSLADKAGIGRRVTPHLLRHSYASGLADLGVPITTIQSALGHASIATTERYIHTELRHRREATAAFGSRWKDYSGDSPRPPGV
jgi:integrase/recombinase XerC